MNPTKDQKRCIEDSYGKPCVVSAGAGSGKTATLTKRVVYALQHPDKSHVRDIDDILAITYTNKAAAELKSRIKAALQEAGLNEQALKVDGAWISTIHGMCSRILRENAFELGIDPNFVVLSDDLRAQLLDQAIDETLLDSCDPKMVERISALQDEYRRDSIHEMLVMLVEKSQACGKAPKDCFHMPPAVDDQDAFSGLVRIEKQFYDFGVENLPDKPASTFLNWSDNAEVVLRDLLGLKDSDGVHAVNIDKAVAARLDSMDLPDKIRGALILKLPASNLNPTKGMPNAAIEREWFGRYKTNLLLALAREHLDTLVDLTGHVLEHFEDAKRDAGALDNDDLIAKAYHALADPNNSVIRERYADCFKMVMVDEFQDTNQMQVDMINLVAGGDREHPSDHMCVVGDAQQSIYRFRNADVGVFMRYKEQVKSMGSKGLSIPMHENYRSHPEILAFAKAAFEGPLGSAYLELLHGRDEDKIVAEKRGYKGASGTMCKDDPDAPRRVNVKVFRAEHNMAGSTDAARATEAASIAADFRALADKGHSPKDMAILLGTMTHADAYAQALRDEGLPCAVTGGSVFMRLPEVKLMLSLADLLVDLHDTTSLACVLSSDIFGLTAQDLVTLMPHLSSPEGGDAHMHLWDALEAWQRSDMLDKDGEKSARAVSAVRLLVSAGQQVGRCPLADIMDEILVDSGWLSRLDGAGDTVTAANAFKVIRMMRDLSGELHVDGLDLARRLRERVESLKEAPGVLSAKGDDFVRIMTIHASKGLQFPIVAVAETDSDNPNRLPLSCVTSNEKVFLALKPALSLEMLSDYDKNGLFKTQIEQFKDEDGLWQSSKITKGLASTDPGVAFGALQASNKMGDEAEQQRKLYVAYTRAEEALFVVLASKTSKPYASVGAPVAIQRLLFGDEGCFQTSSKEFDGSACDLKQMEPLQEDGDEEGWFVRLQEDYVRAPLQGTAIEVAHPSARTGLIPTKLPDHVDGLHPLHQQWAQGILSASAISSQSGSKKPAYHTSAIPQPAVSEDEDDKPASATDKGTAFHAVAEHAARAWKAGSQLAMPQDDRIDALSRTNGLNLEQHDELVTHTRAWVSSDVAKEMAGHKHLEPETPFFVPLTPASEGAPPIELQGYIDLLAYDEMGKGEAFVVDYKTGTSHKTDKDRRDTYENQAKCYAYALLLQGFDKVRPRFVFVEQIGKDGQPEVTEFPAPGEDDYTLEGLGADLGKLVEEL